MSKSKQTSKAKRPKVTKAQRRHKPAAMEPLPFGNAAELSDSEGRMRVPAKIAAELKRRADEVFWIVAHDVGLTKDESGALVPQGQAVACMRTMGESCMRLGFALAITRYAKELKHVGELRRVFKRRAVKANQDKRQKLGLDERDAAIVAEFTVLRPEFGATESQYRLAKKHDLSDKQIRNILTAANKAAR